MPFPPEDLPRAKALTELLCAAAAADDDIDPDELDTVRDELRRILGRIPPEIEAHLKSFSKRGFDLPAVVTRAAPAGLDDKGSVLRAIRSIIKADGALRDVETTFFERVASLLRLPTNDID